ncbi:MAG: hypothetical protein ACI9XZ_000566 [Alphaproteobacteria bacterium]|jgi:hypothetical protein
MIMGLFGSSKKDELPEERGPLAVALGGAVELDTLGLQASLAAGDPALPPPTGGPMVISAIGTAQLDATTTLTRYYDDDDQILQVMASPGGGRETITGVSLYRPWDSVTPMTRSEWERWTGPNGFVGQPEYDADGIMFARYWGEGAGRVDLVEFSEDINDGDTARSIHQQCMLYARPIGSVEEMLLINIERDIGENVSQQGGSVEFLIGYGLASADVQRV